MAGVAARAAAIISRTCFNSPRNIAALPAAECEGALVRPGCQQAHAKTVDCAPKFGIGAPSHRFGGAPSETVAAPDHVEGLNLQPRRGQESSERLAALRVRCD